MNFTAEAIAELLKGEIIGDPSVEVNNVSKIEEGKPGTLSFLANPKYEKYLYTTKSSIVLVNKTQEFSKEIDATIIKVDNAYESLAVLLEMYQQARFSVVGVCDSAKIAGTVKLGEDVYIGDNVVIADYCEIGNGVKIYPNTTIGQNVKIGDNTTIRSGVQVYYDSKIGANCYLHSGVVIGAEGFGFAPQDSGDYKKVPQIGNVVLEDNVELGANTCVDRATLGSTIIRKGVKIDNLVQVAHNVEIGENTVIAAQTGVSGSTKIGKNCMIAGQVGFVGHIEIADKTIIAAQAGVNKSVKKSGKLFQGTPSLELKNFQKSSIYFKRLPEMAQTISQLEQQIKELKEALDK